ncbi:MAG: ribosome assembly RNA-binding protein YhbY [Sulfuriferula sp.]|jgi:RNA-binding protein
MAIMITLNALQRRYLRGQAHHLHPVVMIGDAGLTDAVMREVDINLKSHELIKVRVFGDDRDHRIAILEKICTTLAAAPVQHIGKLLLIYRPATKPKISLPK